MKIANEISSNTFRDLLNLSTKQLFCTINRKLYIQVVCIAIGSTLGLILVDIFLYHHDENYFDE